MCNSVNQSVVEKIVNYLGLPKAEGSYKIAPHQDGECTLTGTTYQQDFVGRACLAFIEIPLEQGSYKRLAPFPYLQFETVQSPQPVRCYLNPVVVDLSKIPAVVGALNAIGITDFELPNALLTDWQQNDLASLTRWLRAKMSETFAANLSNPYEKL